MDAPALSAGWEDPNLLDGVDFDRPSFCFLCAACIPRKVRDGNLGHCPACRKRGVAIVSALMVFGTAANAWILTLLGG